MRGLPTGIELKDLVPQKVEAIAPTHDTGNPILASEFFDTRQVCMLLSLMASIGIRRDNGI